MEAYCIKCVAHGTAPQCEMDEGFVPKNVSPGDRLPKLSVLSQERVLEFIMINMTSDWFAVSCY